MKAPLILSLLILAVSPLSQAAGLFLGLSASDSEAFHLDLANSGPEAEPVWIRYYDQSLGSVEEMALVIEANAVEKMDLSPLQKKTQGLRIITRDSSSIEARAWVESSGNFFPLTLAKLASDSLRLEISRNVGSKQRLNLYNPNPLPTQITVRNLKDELGSLRQLQIDGHESLSVDFSEFSISGNSSVPSTDTLEILAETKIVATLFRWSDQGLDVQVARPHSPRTLDPPAEHKSFFLMGPRNSSEENSNFVVAIADKKLLAQARALVGKEEGPIFIGKLAPTSGGFNRDFNHPASSAWGWHVSQALDFTDFASQKCDGSPEMVEELLYTWMERIGTICFWNYRILKELSPQEVKQGQLRE